MSDGHTDVAVDVAPEVGSKVDHAVLQEAAVAALEAAGDDRDHPPIDLFNAQLEVSIRVTDDAEMRRLNREYRGIDRPTDILSFSLVTDDEGNLQTLPVDAVQSLGDIVVSHAYASRQAEELGHSLEMELSWLVIHGTLQLVGYTHDTDADAEHMEALEHAALRHLGFTVR